MKEFIEKLIGRLEDGIFSMNERMKYDIKTQKHLISQNQGIRYAINSINQLAEEYNNGWIPCSERLPENTDLEYFLVWCKGYFTEGTHIGEECQWYGIGLLYNKNKWEVYQCKDIKDIEVIAWQPLPAPYKKGCE